MNVEQVNSRPCTNCGQPVDVTQRICPNCGYDLGQSSSSVWPPSVPYDGPPIKPLRPPIKPLQVILGMIAGALLVMVGSWFALVGPIIAIVLIVSNWKTRPGFSYGSIAGCVIGLVGIAACIYSLRGL